MGCLRILTDGYFFGTITELLVLPEYQRQGIGSRLLSLAKENTPTILYFGAQPGIEAFYEKNFRCILIDFLGNGQSDRIEHFSPDMWYDEAMQTVALTEHFQCGSSRAADKKILKPATHVNDSYPHSRTAEQEIPERISDKVIRLTEKFILEFYVTAYAPEKQTGFAYLHGPGQREDGR